MSTERVTLGRVGAGAYSILRNGQAIGVASKAGAVWVGKVWGDWGQFEGRTLADLGDSIQAAYDYERHTLDRGWV